VKKKSLILEELLIWFRGRFTLNHEEKYWLLLLLAIFWVGLIGRTIYLKHPASEPIPAEHLFGETQ
jgi:hypothetical protein